MVENNPRLDTYLPFVQYAKDIIPYALSLGMRERHIKELLVDGHSSLYVDPIINPKNGRRHFVRQAEVKVIPKGKKAEFTINGMAPEKFFEIIDQREIHLKREAAKEGEAYDVYRRNLELQDAFFDMEESLKSTRRILELVRETSREKDAVIEKLQKDIDKLSGKKAKKDK